MVQIKIMLVSSFEPWSLGLSYLRAFRKLGYNPDCFDMTIEYEKVSRLTKNRYANRIISRYAARVMNKKLLEMAKNCNPELIFIHKGYWIFPETLKKIKTNTQALLFIFNPDDPFNPNRGSSSKFVRDSIPFYDVYFIWSKTLMPRLEHVGARRVEYLPFACDPELHYPISLTKEDKKTYGSDVVFVGNWDEERERWLSGLEGYNLVIWGADYWRKRCKNKFLRSCWKGRTAIGEEMSKIVQSSKINLNILRLQNKGSHNMRTFEIPACRGFMLHERSEEVLEFFSEGEEIVCFSSLNELREKLDYYLSMYKLREDISQKAFQKVQKYTYYERVKRILEIYAEMKKGLCL